MLIYKKDCFYEHFKGIRSIRICFQRPDPNDAEVSLVLLLFYGVRVQLDHFGSLCAFSLGHLERGFHVPVHPEAVRGTDSGSRHHDQPLRRESRLAALAGPP